MDLNRYLDLYLSESHDHLRLLNGALLQLEQSRSGSAVEEAFRAAHTIKGMSATMGFSAVSNIAHDLETLLEDVRTQRRAVDAALIDELLAGADLLERAVTAAAAGEPVPERRPAVPAPSAPAGPPTESRASVAAQLSTAARYVRVSIEPSEQMKIARALIITRDLVRKGWATRSVPEQFGDDFDGEFGLILTADVEEATVRAHLEALPEISSFSVHSGGDSAVPKPKPDAPRAAPKPTSFLRVDQSRMDEVVEGLGELAILHGTIDQLINGDGRLGVLAGRMARVIADVQHTVLAMRMVPVGHVFDRFPRLVRDAARTLGKDVDFQIEGRDIEIDRSILEEVADPLVHLLRNAIDHGIEAPAERYAAGKNERATLILRAARDRSSVRIQVAEDGRGVNAQKVITKARLKGLPVPDTSEVASEDLLRILIHPGFSTADQVTGVSGRGVGLDAVVNRVRELGGAIDMQTRVGEGTTFTLRLPITLAIAQALRVQVGDEDYAIPLTHVAEAVELDTVRLSHTNGREVMHLRDEVLPLIRLRSVLRTPGNGRETAAVVAELGERRTALAVDRLIGREQILVKHFDGAVGTLPIFSGVTLLADGRPALVLDPVSVV